MLNIKNIKLDKTVQNKKTRKTRKNNTNKNLYNSSVLSPQKIQSILKNRKKTLKSQTSNISLKERQKKIQEQIMKSNNFKDIYKTIQDNQTPIQEALGYKQEYLPKENRDIYNIPKQEIKGKEYVENTSVSEENELFKIKNPKDANRELNQDLNCDLNQDYHNKFYKDDYQDLAENMEYEQIVTVKKLIDHQPQLKDNNEQEKKVSFYGKSPKKDRNLSKKEVVKRNPEKKTKRTRVRFKSRVKTKKYSRETIDKFFLQINGNSNKKNNKKKDQIFKLINTLKQIIELKNDALISKFIKKLKRHHIINMLSLFKITNKKTKAPLKILKFIFYIHSFDNIRILKEF